MARSSLKNVMRLIDVANNELPIEKQFLNDLCNSIEKSAEQNSRKPSQTYKPSGMNCDRAMVYQVLGVEPDKSRASYQLEGICESGTDRHIRIQQAIGNIHDVLGVDCEYINVADFVKQRNIPDLEIVGQSGMETKLYHKKLNMSFMCDGIIKYKGKYYIFEFKTETSNKFYSRTDVDPSHYNQATAYSLAFGINQVLFVYESRDTLDKKAFLFTVTDDMKQNLIGRISYCDDYVSKLKAPPNPKDVQKKTCTYCIYKHQCRKGYVLTYGNLYM